jgi:ribonuclease D
VTEPRSLLDIGSVRNLVCPRHENALARDRSVNSVVFPMEILQVFLADPRTVEACHAGTPDEDITLAGPFLRSIAPACEWVKPESVEAAWQRARELGPGGKA